MFADPAKNIDHFGLHENDFVADLGAGSGAYTLAAARVATKGKVYAVDIQKDMLERLKNQARAAGLGNVEVVWGDLEAQGGSKMRDHVCDAVIISNVLFQAENKEALVKEAKRILKPGGRALVIDWSASFGGIGPRDSDVLPAERATELFTKLGFSLIEQFDAGAHHYGLIMRK